MGKKDEVNKEETFEEKLKRLISSVNSSVKSGKLLLMSEGFERQPCASFGLPSLDIFQISPST